MSTKRERITRLYLPGRSVGPPLSGGTKDSIRFFPTRDVSSAPSSPSALLLARARGPDRRDHRCVFLLNASRVRVVKGSHGWANLLPMGTHGDSGSSPNTPVATRPSYESSTTASSFCFPPRRPPRAILFSFSYSSYPASSHFSRHGGTLRVF